MTDSRVLNIAIDRKTYFLNRDNLSWFDFAKEFVQHLLPNYTVNFLPLGHTTQEKPYIEDWPKICDAISNFVIPYNGNWDFHIKDYVVLVTKARGIEIQFFNAIKESLFETLNSIGLPIVLLGDKELPKTREYVLLSKYKSVFSFYKDSIDRINNNLVVDKTFENLMEPNIHDIITDYRYMANARKVIALGGGGLVSLAAGIGNLHLLYRMDPAATYFKEPRELLRRTKNLFYSPQIFLKNLENFSY